jgi:2-polyprenyl-3-methyl-5-hydroxy-6-metoxy-1,4-benzoquinol methylase
MQEITWNASADAKAVKSITGNMPKDIEYRVQRACQYVAETIILSSSEEQEEDCNTNRVLDVGCGYGVLVPYLQKAGIQSSQIYGIDLSSEMIRNAQSFYPDVTFEGANFLEFNNDNEDISFGAIIFCASLHDIPNMKQVLQKAKSLLSPRKKRSIVIVHPQGASHVIQQHKANPIMVQRGLPTSTELEEWLCNDGSMVLSVQPADPKSDGERRDGYLAVLTTP